MAGPTGVNARTSDGIFPSLGSIQSASYLRAGSVVKNYQDKLDYFISEADEGSNIPITGTTPQLYANPEITTPGTGETNTASNIGIGDGPFAQKVASDLQFNSESYGYGIESQLLDDTYYRGLNPFIADNIGVFSGVMSTTRSTPTTLISSSGDIQDVIADRAAYGVNGLDCNDSYTNYFDYSYDFSQWSQSGILSISTDGTVGPVKNRQAQKVIPSTDLSTHSLGESSIITDPTLTVTTFYIIKPGGYTSATIRTRSGANGFGVVVDLTDGNILPINNFGNGEYKSSKIIKLSGGFLLISLSGIPSTLPSTPPTSDIRIKENFSGSETFAGDGVSGVYLAGAQMTQTPFVKPYIDTSGATVSVANTKHTIPVSGNMPHQGGKFCFVFDCSVPKLDLSTVFTIGGSMSPGFVYLRRDGENDINFTIFDGSATSSLSAALDDQPHRLVVKYEDNNQYIYVDGVQISTKTNTADILKAYSSLDDITIGSSGAGNVNLNSYIKIKKWFTNETPTDAQILEMGGPDNVIL